MVGKQFKILVRLILVLAVIENHCSGAPREFVDDHVFTQLYTQLLNTEEPLEGKAENIDGPAMGPKIYSIDILTPTCTAHGSLRDTKKNQTYRPMAPYVDYDNWIEDAVKLHNIYREVRGYKPVIFSDKLTQISQAYAIAMNNPEAGQTSLEFEVDKSNKAGKVYDTDRKLDKYLDIDILFEEVYLDDSVRFVVPEQPGYLFIGCCPAPFTKEISPDSQEIGIARYVQESVGNFRRIILVASFYPKSKRWHVSNLCVPVNESSLFGSDESPDAGMNENVELPAFIEDNLFGDFNTQADSGEDADAEKQVNYFLKH